MNADIEADNGITTEASNWVFDEHVAPHFDEHVRKSVPEYDRVQELAATFSDWFTHPDCTVLDFGAATGETLRLIRERHRKALTLIGYDNSQAMIAQAANKGIEVTFTDLERLSDIPPFAYGVALYTLQFLRPQARQQLVYQIANTIERGGGLFVVEKVLGSYPTTQDIIQQLYWDMKISNGLTPAQVINKAHALRGCMFPKTIAENEAEFRAAGFSQIELVFKDLQFCGWLLIR
ncbi:methyltransferase domain-containing protein [Ruficoccus sp. ZRK36]|uniref:methyltransferase domain-containing protein n=1 Tax=Ruficoccus sp. ZRK36 TaxID=2866311 RepID=UPI001C735427|nr:methyltransferase domain-containing protein [Ruficoccus sp. ZRK36]QYY34595.1 methyltransferase domain-containing protein [Ruficoccus sp. ZRK36]